LSQICQNITKTMHFHLTELQIVEAGESSQFRWNGPLRLLWTVVRRRLRTVSVKSSVPKNWVKHLQTLHLKKNFILHRLSAVTLASLPSSFGMEPVSKLSPDVWANGIEYNEKNCSRPIDDTITKVLQKPSKWGQTVLTAPLESSLSFERRHIMCRLHNRASVRQRFTYRVVSQGDWTIHLIVQSGSD
jgi:hypothetical protein